jgi:uncharacterized protein YbaR (Trm112 family)
VSRQQRLSLARAQRIDGIPRILSNDNPRETVGTQSAFGQNAEIILTVHYNADIIACPLTNRVINNGRETGHEALNVACNVARRGKIREIAR